MNKIKIVSDPYKEEIKFYEYNNHFNKWQDIVDSESKLLEKDYEKAFLPFKIQEIMQAIRDDYSSSNEKAIVEFEGTPEEFQEVKNVCENSFCDRIEVAKSNNYLENAKYIFEDTKDVFDQIEPIIKKTIKDEKSQIRKQLNKVSDALKDIIPICVFGNYSAGKSTFINALIGYEYLPSGGDPVTAKIYKISRSLHIDTAYISFEYLGEEIKLAFEEGDFRVRKGDEKTDIIEEISNSINEIKDEDIVSKVSKALIIINGFEKRDKENTVIGSVIDIKVPFSKEGILGQSLNNFVIFDTPGSNSASNIDHSKVLSDALEGFSNGIPVWVTTYDSIDSDDNASLCKKIFEIKALDKRFTMIVVNRADNTDLPKNGFSKKQIKDILEYNSVDMMYSSGIYFVSSIIGIGSKNNGKLKDNFYRKVYRFANEFYTNPDDEDYSSLYEYNIMPEQIKDREVKYSKDCSNLAYANSGLLCIEMEMESFATKYAAYNKCQMVKVFLEEVIGETNAIIDQKTNDLKRTREARQKELDATRSKLFESLKSCENDKEREFEKQSREYTKKFVDEKLKYEVDSDTFKEFDSKQRDKNLENVNYIEQEKIISDSKTRMWSHFKSNGKALFTGEFFDSIKSMKDDLVRDIKEIQTLQDKIDDSEKHADMITSDETIKNVIEIYKNNIVDANEKIISELKEYWKNKSNELRHALVKIITESESLTESQRELLSGVILDYQELEMNDNAENIFIKKKFLRGNVLGLKVNDSEKLNIKRLTSIYNDKISDSVKKMAKDINYNYYNGFKLWSKNLNSLIEANAIDYNPKLRSMFDMITEETEKISELEDDRATIEKSLSAIEDMMQWK